MPAYLTNKLNQLGTVWLCALRMQWYMVIVQGAFLDNEEASEALLHLPESKEPHLSEILGGAWQVKAAAVEVLFLVDEPHGRAVTCHL